MEKAKKEIDKIYRKAKTPNHPDRAKAEKEINKLWDIVIDNILRKPKKEEEPWSVS